MFDNFKIHWKILGLVSVLSALTVFVAGMGINSMQTYEMRVDQQESAFNRALYAERVNGLINAVVMDSRGVYMSESSADGKRFGAGLMNSLLRMRQDMDAWSKIVPAEVTQSVSKTKAATCGV